MDTYLRELERRLRLNAEETRAIVAEVRGQLEDLVAHLRAEGYAPEQAEAAAVRRFAAAGGLARAMQRAHRRAPAPLQGAALLVALAGLMGLGLTVSIVQTFVTAATHGIGAVPFFGEVAAGTYSSPWQLLDPFLEFVAPGLVILACAGLSLWIAAGVLVRQRQPWRDTIRGVAIAGFCDTALVLALVVTRPTPPPLVVQWTMMPRAAGMPSFGQAVTRGLAGHPAPGQPTRPAMVDAVLPDLDTTYVAYHIPDAIGMFYAALSDERGHDYMLQAGWGTSPGGVQSTLPWHAVDQGLAEFAPLPDSVHTVVVRFADMQGRIVETVRIPLDLRRLRRTWRTGASRLVVTAAAITVALAQVTRGTTVAQLTQVVTARLPAGQGLFPMEYLIDTHGLPLSLHRWAGTCGQANTGQRCTSSWTFAPPPRGTPLILTLTGMRRIGPHGQLGILHGYWRLRFIMP